MKLCMIQTNTPLRQRHNIYPITIFPNAALLVARHYDKVAAIQFFCTFYKAVHLPLFRLGVAHIIANLYQSI